MEMEAKEKNKTAKNYTNGSKQALYYSEIVDKSRTNLSANQSDRSMREQARPNRGVSQKSPKVIMPRINES